MCSYMIISRLFLERVEKRRGEGVQNGLGPLEGRGVNLTGGEVKASWRP